MSWQERRQNATIETGDGTIFTVEYVDISGSRSESTTVFTFSEFSGDFVQRLSSGSDAYSLAIWFSGADHDLVAAEFEEKTKDNRPLFFTHPFKGRRKYQLLTLGRDDRLVSRANETAFTVGIHGTVSGDLPLSQVDTAAQINAIALAKDEAGANSFEGAIDDINDTKFSLLDAVAEAQTLFVRYFSDALDALAEFEQIRLTAVNALLTIETNLELAAFSVQRLVAFPAKVASSLSDRLSYYADLLSWGTGSDDLGRENLSDFASYQLFQSSSLLGYSQVSSAPDADDFQDREQVFAVSDQLLTFTDDYYTFTDQFESDRDIHSAVITGVALAVGALDATALQARQKRTLFLTFPADVWVLCYRLYSPRTPNELDSSVETFIAINNIVGERLFEIPANTDVVYYL